MEAMDINDGKGKTVLTAWMNELQRNKKAPSGIWYSLLTAGKISQ